MACKILPEDIPDPSVRAWYLKKNAPSSEEVHLLPVEDLGSDFFDNSYIEGCRQYNEQGKLNEDNLYYKYVMHLKNSVSPSDFHLLDAHAIEKKIVERFDVMKSILADGYDQNQHITLWVPRYRREHIKTVISKDGKLITFNTMDGHHRVAAAKVIGMKYIPAIMGKPRFLTLSSLERIAKKYKWTWYQPIDFGAKTNIVFEHKKSNLHGAEKYDFILREALQPIEGQTFLDLGCNTGVVTACIAADRAKFSLGIDYDKKIEQASWVKRTLWSDYGNIAFRGVNIRDNLGKLRDILEKMKRVDCILMSNFVYYLGNKTDDFMKMCSEFTDKIVLQGNGLKTGKPPLTHYRGEYSQIKGMQELLERHGYKTHTIAPQGYPKPVVIGTKNNVQWSPPKTKENKVSDDVKNIISDLKENEYWNVAQKRFLVSIEHLLKFAEQHRNLKIMNIGGLVEEEKIFKEVFGESISYESMDHRLFDAKTDKIPFKDDTFDMVICWETIEHLWTVRADGVMNAQGILHCWKEMNRVLKPSGLFHLTTTNRFCPRTFSFMSPMTIPQVNAFNFTQMDTTIWGHLRELSAEELRRIAKHTNTFENLSISSHACYDHMQPGTTEYKEWSVKFQQYLERPLKQEEEYDTLIFVARKDDNA